MQRFHKRLARREAAESAGTGVVELPPRCPPLEPPDLSQYPEELARKVSRVRGLLGDRLEGALAVVPSFELLHYRHRAEFALRQEGTSVFFTVFDPERREWRDVQQYPIASRRINRMMTELPGFFAEEPRARDRVFEAEFVSNTAGEALVCLKFHRALHQAEDVAMAARLVERLGLESAVLRARGQRLATCAGLAGADRRDAAHAAAADGGDLVETTRVGGHSFPQLLQETAFFQSNLQVNRAMQRWAVAQTLPDRWPPERDLLELFCGNGNFTLPLAGNFRSVLATELRHRSVAAAQACASSAGVANVSIRQMQAELVGSLDAGEFDFGTLLVDPPRKGLDEHSLAVASRMPSVIYVSCGPEALPRDLQQLPDHHVAEACLFDQFPWTDHVEVALRLERAA